MTNIGPNNQQNGCIVINGELSIYTALELKEQLLAGLSTAEELELDVSGVGEVDAAGLQLLVMAKQQANASGKVLRITGHTPVIIELLDLSGLAGFFGDPLLMVNNSNPEGQSI